MWFLYTVLHCFTIALVNYIDEYLTHNNKVSEEASPHEKIGGLILISTLLSVVTIFSLFIYLGDVTVNRTALLLALASSIPMVSLWTIYFYLFLKYPAHQVVPLFGLSSIWLLLIELSAGASINLLPFLGIVFLLYGAYLLDAGTFKWKIPTKLLLIMVPTSLLWAISLYMVRIASEYAAVTTIFFYQYIGIGIIGLALLVCIAPYRHGLVYRIRNQGKNFLGLSFLNETISQISFLLVMLAVSLAPLGAYVTALGGIQSIFVLLLFFLFPMHDRNKISAIQWLAIVFIVVGIFAIELWK